MKWGFFQDFLIEWVNLFKPNAYVTAIVVISASSSSGGPMVNVMSKPKPISVTGMPPINIVSGDRKRKAEDELH